MKYPSIERRAQQAYEYCYPDGPAWSQLPDEEKQRWRDGVGFWFAEKSAVKSSVPLGESNRLRDMIARHSSGAHPIEEVVSGVCAALRHYVHYRDITKPELNRRFEKIATLADQLYATLEDDTGQEAWRRIEAHAGSLPPGAKFCRELFDIMAGADLERKAGSTPGPAQKIEKLYQGMTLAEWWRAATGLEPTFSKSDDDFNSPKTGFGSFVREAVLLLPDHSEFEVGFADFLQCTVERSA